MSSWPMMPGNSDSPAASFLMRLSRTSFFTGRRGNASGAASRARDEYRSTADAALGGFDLLLTPTLASVAPPVGIGDAVLRERMIRLTYPFNALGWPALALPCGPAEDGLPASVQLVGRTGDDALVLAAGRRLASLLRGTPGGP